MRERRWRRGSAPRGRASSRPPAPRPLPAVGDLGSRGPLRRHGPGEGAPRRSCHIGEAEVQPPADLVDLDELHSQRIAEPKRRARAAAAQPMLLLLVDEEIVAQRRDRYEALDEEI